MLMQMIGKLSKDWKADVSFWVFSANMAAIKILPIAILVNLYSFFIYYIHLYTGFLWFYTCAIYIYGFWLMTECWSQAYAIMICLSLSLLSLVSSVSTPPDHILGQIRFRLCMHMHLYPV